MQRYRDLKVSSPTLNAASLVAYIESFAKSTGGWEFIEEKSALYAAESGKPSCCFISASATHPRAALHLTVFRDDTLYMPNIVPLEKNSLTKDEYNTIAARFARELGARSRSDNMKINLTMSKATIHLRDLISGKKTWRLLRSYLDAFPHSHHPNDIRRLDNFICALFRYSRKTFDASAFEYLLQEDEKWPVDEAARCRHRVEIGLEVLEANKRF
ncbi:MAG: hypothetical protein E6Q50_17215 [Lysobacter sp.]|nr:MAG: hypothetical protein E6Q50_17215 [Lysobacter sp.]